MDKLKEKIHTILSTDAEKASDKIHYPSMMKWSARWEWGENFFT